MRIVTGTVSMEIDTDEMIKLVMYFMQNADVHYDMDEVFNFDGDHLAEGVYLHKCKGIRSDGFGSFVLEFETIE